VVAGCLGRAYFGVDLSAEQVEANKAQAREIFWQGNTGHIPPTWINADSREIAPELRDMDLRPDMIFTCPPYGDLEVYSEDPHDLSNMDPEGFDQAYFDIIKDAVGILNNDRFAAIVVGNYRDKRGHLRDLIGLTVRAFEAAGARFYNEAVVLDPIGSAAVRAKRQFSAKRKMVRVHQNLLVFVKGDESKATEAVRKENEK
jgi:DNA modification methylase